ncbi:von Willebrand factor type A [uncultured Paludibacter sp.]|nr:von Willebrand factor type A [uncultured Paludibacter sp.]
MKTRMKKMNLMLLFTAFSAGIMAQEINVHGTVFSKTDHQPIIGASVSEKGTTNGVVSDVNGQYKIRVKKNKKLEFSYIGFVKQTIKVKSDTLLNIYLEEAKTLDEVVVIGYGTTEKKDLTGSVATVGYNNALSGKVAGIRIRGYSSFVPQYYSTTNTEEYGKFSENRFKSAKDEPLSTFSLDVDAASYSNIRRMINNGQKPEKDAVRVEEMINYFSYNYSQPTGEHPVNILTETTTCPWQTKHQLVRIGVKAKEIPSENLPVSNFVFLLDVSGSMNQANKLPLVKSSIKLLVNNLREKDRVAIVVYAGAAGVVLESTKGTDKQKIIEAIDNLQAGGSTAGGAGIQLAYKIAEKNLIKEGNNRIILCTDGDFNVGVSDEKGLENLVEEKRKSGVFLTVLGYGMGNYKDNKLQILAEKGNGNHAYIDNLQEANKVLVNEFGSTMYTVAKDVKIQVEFNPKYVNAYRLVGYESRLLNKEDFNDDTKDAGELGSGHTVTAIYEIIPVGVENTYGGVDKLKYQKESSKEKLDLNNSNELLTVKLRYKKPNENTSEKLELPVMANVSKTNASADLNFQMAVAMFGQLLRNSDFKGDATYDKVIELAKKGLDEDKYGYRREFIRLVESVSQLEK